MKIRNILFLLAAGQSALLSLSADTITTQDGSSIMGKILGIENGVIKIETAFAGVLEVKKEAAVSINTDSPVFVEFASGNTLYGKVQSSGSNISVTAEDGHFTSTVSKVKASWHEGEDSPTVKAMKAELKAKERKWAYEAGIDIAGNSGNKESLSTGLSFKATLASDEDKLELYANYNYGETDKSVSVDNSKAGVRYQSDFYENIFWYVRDELGRDRVQDLDFYNVAGLGLGYKIIANDKQNLSFNAGLAYRFETYGDGTDISVPAGDFGLEHDYNFGYGKLFNKVQFIPSFDDLADYRVNHESGVEFPIGTGEMWKLRAGIGHNYHSTPTANRDKLDTNYFTRLVLSWK